jgi:hypothetical protein
MEWMDGSNSVETQPSTTLPPWHEPALEVLSTEDAESGNTTTTIDHGAAFS